jgi:hypothetical protein
MGSYDEQSARNWGLTVDEYREVEREFFRLGRSGRPTTMGDVVASFKAQRSGGGARASGPVAYEAQNEQERRLLEKMDGNATSGRGPHMEGTRLVLDYMSPEQAAARAQEMLAAGLVPAHSNPQGVTSKVLETKAIKTGSGR